MFSFLRKKRHHEGFAGISLSADGVAVTHLLADAEIGLRLASCEFRPCGVAEQGAVLAELVTSLGLQGAPAALVLTPDECRLLLVEAPPMEDLAEMKAAIPWQIKEMIDFPLEEAVIDAIPGPQQRGTRMAYAAVARRSLVETRIALMREAGLEVAAVDVPELALRNLAAALPENESGVCVINLTRSHGLIILVRQGELALARQTDYGLSRLAGGGSDPFDMVVLEVQRSLDYYESHFQLPPPPVRLPAPLDAALPGLARYLRDNLSVPVEVVSFERLFGAEQAPEQAQEHETPIRCTSALGAALRFCPEGGRCGAPPSSEEAP